jgi:hypothetical protein
MGAVGEYSPVHMGVVGRSFEEEDCTGCSLVSADGHCKAEGGESFSGAVCCVASSVQWQSSWPLQG